ncbi:alpha-1,2-fucosyltransferase [Mucilaginibacter antarcticus]|uniref:Alpha-1,2-fucosyltransferase n=1 Tax=Mucilaginibacter antarcticus TaxID=1855725 RepID=A0ABW5XRG4_9SPHI
MVIVKLKGGLGNQMFQYATAYALAKSIKSSVYIDKSFLEKRGQTNSYTLRNYELGKLSLTTPRFVNRYKLMLLKLKSKLNTYLPSKLKFSVTFQTYTDQEFEKLSTLRYPQKGLIYLDGYFQTEDFIITQRDELLSQFNVRQKLDSVNSKLIDNIIKENSVSIHIRRGDYVTNTEAGAFHGVCSLAYYKSAIEIIVNTIEAPSFYFFSDDLEWVKKEINVPGRYKTTYVDNNQNENQFDLLLMSKCKHNIIANSSFSWWGAWLNQNSTKTVIAPGKWFAMKNELDSNIIPSYWIAIN